MIDSEDLNLIIEDLLPLFDYTQNVYSKKILKELMVMPLASVDNIYTRQHILKGFKGNQDTLDQYSYSLIYFMSAHEVMQNHEILNIPKNVWRYKMNFSSKKREDFRSKFAQMVLLFDNLDTLYFSKLNLSIFPSIYNKEIQNMMFFMRELEPNKNANLIRENRFNDSHVVALANTLSFQQHNINYFWNTLFVFESYISISKAISKHNLTFPVFGDKMLKLNNFYHPLLKQPVINSFETSDNVILLNGPNMSGKSTFLKAMTICIYLGHLGFAIPAKESNIPFFSKFLVLLNKRDYLDKGYSHFMRELKGIESVLNYSELGGCFAIFDELFSGTNAEDASEILKVTIGGLAKLSNSLFFISTHIQELRGFSHNKLSTFYIECKLIDENPIFTYKIIEGWSDIKIGRILFKREGLYKRLLNNDS
jgi:DNA mismatch repair protein MutS